jgi:hypothetical protein
MSSAFSSFKMASQGTLCLGVCERLCIAVEQGLAGNIDSRKHALECMCHGQALGWHSSTHLLRLVGAHGCV